MKLPPLHLLNIFAVAGRLQSYKAASEELYLTPSAVSHQVKKLEQFLGVALFKRSGRKVELTAAGKQYLNFIEAGLVSFKQGTRLLQSQYANPSLRVSTFSTVATRIVIPQLGLFQKSHPDIDIRVETSSDLVDLRHSDVDIALRIGNGQYPDTKTRVLTDIYITPVCSAEFAEFYNLKSITQILELPLIDISSLDNVWERWCNEYGMSSPQVSKRLSFTRYDDAIQAASEGLGLALAMLPIENNALAMGQLVQPFSNTLMYDHKLLGVYRSADAHRHEITCFLDWLAASPKLK